MFKCNECDYTQEKTLFKCKCGSIDIEEIENSSTTFVEKGKIKKKKIKKHDFGNTSVKNISIDSFDRLDTGISQLNTVFGESKLKDGSIVEGIAKSSLTLISGEPGVGKSTLLLQLIDKISKIMKSVYISAEENQSQIKNRYNRLGCTTNFDILHETNYDLIEEFIFESNADFIIIDSINTIFRDGLGTIGGVSQIKENTLSIMNLAKKYNKTIILIAQVSKTGDLAGPKILEHMVDSYFHIEAFDSRNRFKILNSNKNRFGLINENVIFEMTGNGLKEVIDSSSIFMEEESNEIGTSLSLIFKGQRPIFVEVESLVVNTTAEKSLIQASGGIDNKRYFQYLAILQKYANINSFGKNIFSNISGGVALKHKDNVQLDLAIICSILSSEHHIDINKYVFIGEVSLSGLIKKVPNEDIFIQHIKKMGLDKEVISNSTNYKHISDIIKLFI
jgi:DNA repair protein RadA/Sms